MSSAMQHSAESGDRHQEEKDDEENLSHASGCPRQLAEAKNTGGESEKEECKRPVEHGVPFDRWISPSHKSCQLYFPKEKY
jgi:hypothetical protein